MCPQKSFRQRSIPHSPFMPSGSSITLRKSSARCRAYVTSNTWRLLGITAFDLYIPILTFVFGEAQLGGSGAVVSYHRLQQEFYGLPPDPDLLANRLLIEAVHELGHTLRLTHCHDYQCAMAPSHAVEWIDIKDSGFCEDCLSRVLQT